MNSILEKLNHFTADQFGELVVEHLSIQRTNRAEYTEARAALARIPGSVEAAAGVGPQVTERMNTVGFFGGREKAIAAARSAVAADMFRDQLSAEQFCTLTATFNTVAGTVAA
ncbi:hypothetical protein [Leifsonia sp. Leaf264]|uniref:hypothetical protein n=1 Tax=Leifsonia sp. Leaf264 TaxID=1736314 RepID=UPI0006FD25EE|nr:hypothetical protein [Leifsonia sp. Leaf264]KQO98138.1 hypothetical protein ASF30_08685 [Leifsonia sp. Leaf264]